MTFFALAIGFFAPPALFSVVIALGWSLCCRRQAVLLGFNELVFRRSLLIFPLTLLVISVFLDEYFSLVLDSLS